METLFIRPIRLTGAMALLAATILLIDPLGPATAWAAGNGGDHGGARDQVKDSGSDPGTGYTNYSANPDTPVDPCQSCYGGSGTDAQNLTTYEYGAPKPCSSCVTGEAGK